MSTVEIEPRLPEGRVKEWRRRHDSTVKTLTESHEPATQVVVKKRAEPKPESKEKSGKNVLRRAWDAIPTWVKVAGGVVLAAFLSQYFFKFMRDQHGAIGRRTLAAGRGTGDAVQGSNVTSGQTGRGSPLGGPGTGIGNRNRNIAGSSDRPVPQDPEDQ